MPTATEGTVVIGQVETALYLLLAVALTFVAIRPVYRLFAPKVHLPPTVELVGIVTFLLIVSPLSALVLFALSLPLLALLAWAVAYVAPTQATAVQHGLESLPAWAPPAAWFALLYLAVFLNGLHGYISSSNPLNHKRSEDSGARPK
jgi:hypothetical protein